MTVSLKYKKYSRLFTLIAFSLLSNLLFAQQDMDAKVQELLNKMTIEEKAGQMTQVTIDLILKDGSNYEIDTEKLKHAIVDMHVGSILNVKGHAYSMDTWHTILEAVQKTAVEATPNHIPILYGIDAIHGPNYLQGATLFPHNTGMAATRNTELVKEAAHITAQQTRASGITWDFDPVLGLARQPLWPRFEETFGEDVYLVSQMGAAAISGYEQEDLRSNTAVASCMKHYIGYSLPLSGKDRTPAYIPEYILREYLLPPFEAAVKAGASTAMINSGEINGIPVHASKYYLTDILRGELGFEGVAVSDWEDVIRLHTRHRVADSPKEAVRMAVEAGLDMSMVPFDYSFYNYLVQLVKEGAITEKRLDESVARILKLKFRLGLFDDPYPNKKLAAKLNTESFDKYALQAALESMTLLKNDDNVLPLPANAKILLAGPTAHNVTSLHSSWSYTWTGEDESQYPTTTLTIKEAFEKALGAENVICSATRDFAAAANYDVGQLKKDAAEVDYIVLCLGEKAYAEGLGVIDDLNLDAPQLELAQAAIATGKKVILVLVEGRPRLISSIEPKIPGILMAYRPSTMGAQAITDVLLGNYNPSGKLPFTYPARSGDIVMYDHKGTEVFREDGPGDYGDGGFRPMFPFGHGLSYTTFTYNDLQVSASAFRPEDILTVTVKVSNTGSRKGSQAVELYSRDLYATVTPSVKRLRKFKKVELAAGETKTVRFTVSAKDLAFVGEDGKWITESGDFEIWIGDQKTSIRYDQNTSGTR
ncbi:MAG TPA: beta-glucosidase [Cryomorphaceae bacterium]|nr:beta-glucosidase [Owenweeksia sp.]MBF97888.1 beta-glucosidase [Owenweeksia sp.]HAD97912.1 beta-glucosidase [Cryomorphaceae bacterium]HBF21976.1 beta-glucosidase [Cryomorphaceae bacterium]